MHPHSPRSSKAMPGKCCPDCLWWNKPSGSPRARCLKAGTSAGLDKLSAPEPQRAPVLVNRHRADRIESLCLQGLPTRVAIEVALVLLRRPLGIGEPHHRIALCPLLNLWRQSIHLALLRHKCQREPDLRQRLEVSMNRDHGQPRKLGFKCLRRMQDENHLLVLQVEFFEDRSHKYHDRDFLEITCNSGRKRIRAIPASWRTALQFRRRVTQVSSDSTVFSPCTKG